jgi:nitrite reductase/ring-hydroxylating ferredoxin subunit
MSHPQDRARAGSGEGGGYYYAACKSEEIGENSMRLFRIGRTEVLIGRLRGRLFACNNSCPHRGASLAKGDLKGDNIVCYMHGYEYSVFTGKLEKIKSWKKEDTWMEQSPEWRKSGDLILYQVTEKDGTIYVRL